MHIELFIANSCCYNTRHIYDLFIAVANIMICSRLASSYRRYKSIWVLKHLSNQSKKSDFALETKQTKCLVLSCRIVHSIFLNSSLESWINGAHGDTTITSAIIVFGDVFLKTDSSNLSTMVSIKSFSISMQILAFGSDTKT